MTGGGGLVSLTFDGRLVQYRVNRFGVDRCQRMRRPVGWPGARGGSLKTAAICCPDTAAVFDRVDSLIAVISVYAAFESLFWKRLKIVGTHQTTISNKGVVRRPFDPKPKGRLKSESSST